MLFFQQTMSPLFFLSLALALCRQSFPRWASLACRLLSLFLSLSLVEMTINLRLKLWTTLIQKQFPLSVFVFVDSLVVSASQHAGGYKITRQKSSSCIWVAIPVQRLSYFTLVCLWCGRAYGHVITKITWMDRLPHLLRYGATLTRVELRC